MGSTPEMLVCSCLSCPDCCSCCLHRQLKTLSSTCCLTVIHFFNLRAAVPLPKKRMSLFASTDTSLLGFFLLGETAESILCLGEEPRKLAIVFVCHRHLTFQCLNIFLNFDWNCFPPSRMLEAINY